jgi:hypothetical protein
VLVGASVSGLPVLVGALLLDCATAGCAQAQPGPVLHGPPPHLLPWPRRSSDTPSNANVLDFDSLDQNLLHSTVSNAKSRLVYARPLTGPSHHVGIV